MPFLDDGYTIDTTIAAVCEAPAFDVTYRPVLRSERNRLANGIVKAHDSGDHDRMVEWENRVLDCLVRHIVKWSLRNGKGQPVKKSPDALQRMDEEQYTQLYGLIMGYSEPKPDESEEDTDAKN